MSAALPPKKRKENRRSEEEEETTSEAEGWVLLNSSDVVSEPPQHNSPNPLTKEGNSPKQLTREEDNSPQQENSPHLTRREDDDRAVSPPVVQRHPLSPPSPRLSSSPPHLPPGSSSPASPPRASTETPPIGANLSAALSITNVKIEPGEEDDLRETGVHSMGRDDDQGGFDLKSLQPALPGPTPFQNLQDFQLQLQLQFLKRTSATLVLPPRLPGLAQPLLPPFSFPPEPIFPLPHPAPIYGHPFRHPLMGLQPPVPSPVLLPSQTSFEHRTRRCSSSPESSKFESPAIADGLSANRKLSRDDDSLLSRSKNKRQKDDRLAADLGLSSVDQQKVVSTGMDEFQDFLSTRRWTEEQQHQLRDIRRRGKNKVAAQNCRKRKLDQLDDLQHSVDGQKEELKQKTEINEKLEMELRDLLAEVDKLMRGAEEHGPGYVGIPTRYEPYREQLMSMKVKPKIFCRDCKPMTKECFEKHEIGCF